MDRDKRYERNELAYRALVEGDAPVVDNALEGVRQAYAKGENDEFIKPFAVRGDDVRLSDGDGLFFFNFRADRARQICRALFDADFDGFARGRMVEFADFATMTRYESDFPMPVAFAPESYEQTLGQVVSEAGLRQLRIAETEKYAHVTYFLNCGREEPFEGEDRIMVQSPRDVATYDLKPQMSADEVADRLVAVLDDYDLCVCNFANLDMVGHTGVIEAAEQACRTVDSCVERVVEAVLERGGTVLLTADHGNAEEMIGPDGGPQTSHSTNPVPLVFIGKQSTEIQLESGILGDIAPTILGILNIDRPAEMTGKNLLQGKG
jgi:2,3-bisphosphoglycerate-independent phosphoglycerate mutase